MPTFTPSSLLDLTGKVYLITGGNAGIGYETITQLARKNATVWMGVRSKAKGEAAIASIQVLVPGASIQLLLLDHMDLASIVVAAKEFRSKSPKLHCLINNAGIMVVPFEETKDGHESQWQTNYLAHWVLTHHVLPTLLANVKVSQPGDVRIVNITSVGHNLFAPEVGIDFEDINQLKGGEWSRYGQSKLGNILHVKGLTSLYGPNGSDNSAGEIWSMAVHPGNIYTNLNNNAAYLSRFVAPVLNFLRVYIPVDQGASTQLFCAASQNLQSGMSGEYPHSQSREVQQACKGSGAC